MTDRWSKIAPLTGVLFAVVTVVAAFMGVETPEASAGAAKVVLYYRAVRAGDGRRGAGRGADGVERRGRGQVLARTFGHFVFTRPISTFSLPL